mmetsp:Transcript_52255/g.127657  ORF Transcript_52255/g.127657 Transcript_52255/m.127657 type:complete len:1059 (-) Transcript_52255:1811-4987(-)
MSNQMDIESARRKGTVSSSKRPTAETRGGGAKAAPSQSSAASAAPERKKAKTGAPQVGDTIVVQWAYHGPHSKDWYEGVIAERVMTGKDRWLVQYGDGFAPETLDLTPEGRGKTWMTEKEAEWMPIVLLDKETLCEIDQPAIIRLEEGGPKVPHFLRAANTKAIGQGIPTAAFSGSQEDVLSESWQKLTNQSHKEVQMLDSVPGCSTWQQRMDVLRYVPACGPAAALEKSTASVPVRLQHALVSYLSQLPSTHSNDADVGLCGKLGGVLQGLAKADSESQGDSRDAELAEAEKAAQQRLTKETTARDKLRTKCASYARKIAEEEASVQDKSRWQSILGPLDERIAAANNAATTARDLEKCLVSVADHFIKEVQHGAQSREAVIMGAINKMTEEVTAIAYHERFFTSGDLHPDTPPGAAGALMLMKRDEVRRASFALQACVAMIGKLSSAVSGNTHKGPSGAAGRAHQGKPFFPPDAVSANGRDKLKESCRRLLNAISAQMRLDQPRMSSDHNILIVHNEVETAERIANEMCNISDDRWARAQAQQEINQQEDMATNVLVESITRGATARPPPLLVTLSGLIQDWGNPPNKAQNTQEHPSSRFLQGAASNGLKEFAETWGTGLLGEEAQQCAAVLCEGVIALADGKVSAGICVVKLASEQQAATEDPSLPLGQAMRPEAGFMAALYAIYAHRFFNKVAVVRVHDGNKSLPLSPLAGVTDFVEGLTVHDIHLGNKQDENKKFDLLRESQPIIIVVCARTDQLGVPVGTSAGSSPDVCRNGLDRVCRQVRNIAENGRVLVVLEGRQGSGWLHATDVSAALMGRPKLDRSTFVQRWEPNVTSTVPLQDLGFEYSTVGRLGGELRGSQHEILWHPAHYAHFLDDDKISPELPSFKQDLLCGVPFKLQIIDTQSKGLGVIALEPIPKGRVVCEYIGEVLLRADARSREQVYIRNPGKPLCYIIDIRGDANSKIHWSIDATTLGNASRFINHSCEANLTVVEFMACSALVEDCAPPRVALVSACDINAGEELTFCYSNHHSESVPSQSCACGTGICTGIMVFYGA